MAKNFEIIINLDEEITMADGQKHLFTVEEAIALANDHNCKWICAPHVPDEHSGFNHWHFGLHTESDNTYDTIAKWFGLLPNSIASINKRFDSTYALYLIHYNQEGKTPVDTKLVRSSFGIDYDKLINNVKKKAGLQDVFDKIASEEIKPYNITRYVDINTYVEHKYEFERAFEYVQKEKTGVDRDMKCAYIYGPSGCGKTTMAKIMATQKGYSTYISSGGKNPLDNYAGEECIVLDDLRGNIFPLSDFLKLTDNNTDSLVGCRYYNKSIAYCKLLICTSVNSPEELYAGVTDEHKEPLKQLLRRFTDIIELDDEYMKFYSYDPQKERLVYGGRLVNPVAMMYNKTFAKRTVDAFADAFGFDMELLKAREDKQMTIDEFSPLTDDESPFTD